MPTSLEDCDCNKICPESTDCTCIWFASTSVCECDCSGPIVIGPTLLAEDRIAISSKGKTLAELGELLNRLCEVELLIPAGRARGCCPSIHQTTVGEVIAQLGLVIDRPAKHNQLLTRTEIADRGRPSYCFDG
jgi:hypothetical protein